MRTSFARATCAAFGLGIALSGCVSPRIARLVDDAVAGPAAGGRFAGVVLVARDGHPLFLKAYGLADREQRIAHTAETPFMIMSVSKQFTAALILRLVAAGRLRLDDRVSKYLDHWPAEWDDVEVRHLLSHASGLPIDATYFWLVKQHPEYWADTSNPPPLYEPAPLLAPPGQKYQYANVGYTLLSRIAARAGQRPFDDLLRDEVLRPLGLAHTWPERDARVPGRARGYTRTEQGLVLSEQKTIDVVGAGDLVSTVGDLARFDAAFDNDRFLPAALRKEMLTPHVDSSRYSLGYGWFLRTSDGGRALQYHPGDGAGFRAFNYRLPNERLTIVILSNVGEHDLPWISPLVDRISEVVSDELQALCVDGVRPSLFSSVPKV